MKKKKEVYIYIQGSRGAPYYCGVSSGAGIG
jgi:hypothetical protein